MVSRLALWFALTLSLAGCGGGVVYQNEYGPFRLDRPERTLVLGQESKGDTTTPDARTASSCKAGGRAGQALDHLYGFEVKETASYRFELVPQFDGVIQVQQKKPDKPWYFGIGCTAGGRGNKATMSIALEPGFYWVVVDGNMWDERGEYSLRVDVDTSDKALLRPEDPQKMAELSASAPPLRVGERSYGVWKSFSGGARTSCGVLGGDAVRKLSLDRPTRVRIRAAAHFALSLEVRPSSGAPVCARAPEGRYEAEVIADLPAGDHLIVLDSTRIATRDGNSSFEPAQVKGAYIVDAAEVQP